MSGEQKAERTCAKCGATITIDELKTQAAARFKGNLLCPVCVKAIKARLVAQKDESAPAESAGTGDPTDEPIALVDLIGGDDDSAEPSSQIHGFSGAGVTAGPGQAVEQTFKRPLLTQPGVATRCKTFHCKLTDASMVNLNEQVNEWVDEHEDVQIKFALSDIGVIEGKHADPHLIVTIFY